jgi:hypothetical protein
VPQRYGLVVDIELNPECPPRVRMANPSGSADDVLPGIEDQLRQALFNIPPPNVKGLVRFQVLSQLQGVAGSPSQLQ